MKAVIFDLDQTLLDRELSLLNFLQWQCRGMLKPYVQDEEKFIRRFIQLDANGSVWKDEVYASLIEDFGLDGWSAPELLSVYVNCFCAFSIPTKGAVEAVTTLSKQFKVGLISNGKSPFQERNFHGLEIASLFQSVLVSEAVGLRKPDAEIFLMSCRELEVKPEDAFYVGDNPTADIQGAAAAGLKTVFIPSQKYLQSAGADFVCEDLSLLPDVIQP